MHQDTGTFTTAKASQYLQQLCKHFAHKLETSFDAESGTIGFPFGPAVLTADPAGLTIAIEAEDADGLARARIVIDKHLERFAFREAFCRMNWASNPPE